MQTGYQLVASGLEDPSYFATYFNIALAGLYHNPYRNVPDEEAEEKFWEDGDYIWLLYWRGFSYAFHLAGIYEKETSEPNALWPTTWMSRRLFWNRLMNIAKGIFRDNLSVVALNV